MKPRARSRLIWLVATTACTSASQPEYRILTDFVERATPLTCNTERTDGAPDDVTQVSDSTFAALYADDRTVILYNARLDAIRTWHFERAGPRSMTRPTGIAVLEDSLLYIADRTERTIRLFRPTGEPVSTLRTEFLPQQLVLLGKQLAVSPLVTGSVTRTLLYLVDGDSLLPVPIPVANFADFSVKAIGNMVELTSRADGSLVIAHQYLVPRMFVRNPAGTVESHLVGVPEDAVTALDYVPEMPITEESIAAMYVNVLSAATSSDGEYLYLTRTGRERDATAEKALVRLDSSLAFVRAYLLPKLKAGHLVWLTRTSTAVLAGEDGSWISCALP